MLSSAILAVLTLLEQFIPLLGTTSATTTMIDGIINALVQLMPFITNEISTVYTSVKNIVDLLNNSGQMTPSQVAVLQQLDQQVDAAWAAVLPQIDPDNPANKGTPAGDPGTA